MPTVKTQLVLNIDHDQKTRAQTNSKSQNIDRTKGFLPIEISQRDNQIISKHDNPPSLQVERIEKPLLIEHEEYSEHLFTSQ